MLSSGLHAEDFLEDATLLVAPGEDPASGLVALPGIAIVTIKAKQDYLSNVTYIPVDGTVLTDFKDRSGPCDNNSAWTTWRWDIAAPITNSDVSAITKGLVVRCSGSGGAPPEFKGRIVHVDIDADTDNTSDPLTAQKRPDVTDEEDAAEWPVGADADKKPGLVLIVNHGFEEDGYGDGSSPIEDFKKDGVKTDDLDLSQSVLKITGGRHGNLKLTYDDTKLKVYRDTGSSVAELWKPGQSIPLDPGTYHLLFEGLAAGVAPITADFYPDQGTGQPAEDKIKITVVDLSLHVDRNRDGQIQTDGQDLTNADSRFPFWYNNDRDDTATDLRPVGLNNDPGDYGSSAIKSLRDLEDFQRLRTQVGGVTEAILDDRMTLSLSWSRRDLRGTPKLRCFRMTDGKGNPDLTGSLRYLTEEVTADWIRSQADPIGEVDSKEGTLNRYDRSWQKRQGDLLVGSLLWECIGEDRRPSDPETTTLRPASEGALQLVLHEGGSISGRPLAVFRHLYLHLADMRSYYEHWTAGDAYTDRSGNLLQGFRYTFPEPTYTKATDSPTDLSVNDHPGLWDPRLNETTKASDKVLLFVHGYRMATWERRAFAETMYKRLYWQGFNGRFVFFSWPTEYVANPIFGAFNRPQNYDRSEFQARRSGYVLGQQLLELQVRLKISPQKFFVSAHSMGNVVISEALRAAGSTGIAQSYLSFQSAEASGAYKLDAPPMASTLLSQVTRNRAYTPDLYAFDAPQQERSLVSWDQWLTPARRSEPTTGPNRAERLRPVIDGLPMHRRLAGVPQRVTYFNQRDPATAGAWPATQSAKPDIGFGYRVLLSNRPRQAPGPRYSDEYRITSSGYLAGEPFARLLSSPASNGGYLLRWTSIATNADEQMEHAALLAFVVKPRSGAVGESPGDVMTVGSTSDRTLTAGFTEAVFTDSFDAGDKSGFGGDPLHDHSGQYEYWISKSKGPRQFWIDVLKRME